MRYLCICTIVLSFISMQVNGQQSSMSIFANSSFFCTSEIKYRVTVTNIDVVNDPLPLTNTSVTVQIWPENADPTVDSPASVSRKTEATKQS